MKLEFLILLIACISVWLFKRWKFNLKKKRRRNYYTDVFLKSNDWKRKRYVVLKRDNWKCVHYGNRATEVHNCRAQRTERINY